MPWKSDRWPPHVGERFEELGLVCVTLTVFLPLGSQLHPSLGPLYITGKSVSNLLSCLRFTLSKSETVDQSMKNLA